MMTCPSLGPGVMLAKGCSGCLSTSMRRLTPSSNVACHQKQHLDSWSLTRRSCSTRAGAGATRLHQTLRPVERAGSPPLPSSVPGRKQPPSVTEIDLHTSPLTFRLSSSFINPSLPPPPPLHCSTDHRRLFSTSVQLYTSRQSSQELADSQKDPVQQEENQDRSAMPSETTGSVDAYSKAFNNNSEWRRSLKETNPELFESMGKGQQPQILWIGCADSRCPETTILGLNPGEIFCHRNIANILVNTDINSLSVIQFAVQYLQVKHIIICGHTSCGGIAAALGNKKLGLIDTWLMPLRALRQDNLALLNSLDETQRGLKLVELNVRQGVKVLLANPVVIDAMHERGLQVHGLIYNVGTGELRELDIEEDEEVVKGRVTAFKTED